MKKSEKVAGYTDEVKPKPSKTMAEGKAAIKWQDEGDGQTGNRYGSGTSGKTKPRRG